jgi:hypothetical protein
MFEVKVTESPKQIVVRLEAIVTLGVTGVITDIVEQTVSGELLTHPGSEEEAITQTSVPSTKGTGEPG